MAKKTGTLGPVEEETGKGSAWSQIYDLIGGKYLVIAVAFVIGVTTLGIIAMTLVNNISTAGETPNPLEEGNLPDGNVPFADDKTEEHEDGSIAKFAVFSTQKLNDKTPDLIKSEFGHFYITASSDDFIVKIVIENQETKQLATGSIRVKYIVIINDERVGIENIHEISKGFMIHPGERVEITKDFQEIQHLSMMVPIWKNDPNCHSTSIEVTSIDL